MAISKNERKQYLYDWNEVVDHVAYGYVEKTILILADQGLDVSKSKIYNVVNGSTKDRTILNAIRKVVLPQHHEPQLNTKINSKHLNLS
jgi:hypothetical protein